MSRCISCRCGEAEILDSEGEGLCPGCWEIYGGKAIAAGTRSAETNEDLAQSEGCQSGAKAHRPNSTGHHLHKRSD